MTEVTKKIEEDERVVEILPVKEEEIDKKIPSIEKKIPIIEKKLSSNNKVYLNAKINNNIEMYKVHDKFDNILSKAANKEEVFNRLVKTVLMYEKISL